MIERGRTKTFDKVSKAGESEIETSSSKPIGTVKPAKPDQMR